MVSPRALWVGGDEAGRERLGIDPFAERIGCIEVVVKTHMSTRTRPSYFIFHGWRVARRHGRSQSQGAGPPPTSLYGAHAIADISLSTNHRPDNHATSVTLVPHTAVVTTDTTLPHASARQADGRRNRLHHGHRAATRATGRGGQGGGICNTLWQKGRAPNDMSAPPALAQCLLSLAYSLVTRNVLGRPVTNRWVGG